MERPNCKRETRKLPTACIQEQIRFMCLRGYFGQVETGFCTLAAPWGVLPPAIHSTQGYGKGHCSLLSFLPFPQAEAPLHFWKLQHCGKNTGKKINTKLYHKSKCWIPSKIRANSIQLLGNYGLLSEHSFDLSSSWFGSGLCPNLLKNSSVRTVKGSTIGFTVLFPLAVKCFGWKQLGSEAFFLLHAYSGHNTHPNEPKCSYKCGGHPLFILTPE